MFNLNYVKFFVVISLAAVTAMPLYVGLYLTPPFQELIKTNAEKEAVRVASHLVSIYVLDRGAAVSDETGAVLAQDEDRIRRDFQLKKLKLYSPSGEIVFSTNHEDIGQVNRHRYFHDTVSSGKAISKIVIRGEPSLQGEYFEVDLVETYVPIMKNGSFNGAFEIYFDITDQNEKLRRLVWQVQGLLAIVVGVCIPAILVIYKRTIKHHRQCQRLEKTLQDSATTDELTGLLNRRGFMAMAAQQLKVSSRSDEDLYLFYADIDNMKWINDTLGHQGGDEALRDTAATLKGTFRDSDIFSRFGGDEFAALLSCGPEIQGEKQITDRFQKNLNMLNARAGRTYELRISVGVVKCDTAPCSIEKLMALADALMYQQKARRNSGKNQTQGRLQDPETVSETRCLNRKETPIE